MKRALVEWGAIFSLAFALASLSYGVVTSFSDVADFQLSPLGYFQVSAADGELLLCDALGNLEVIELLDRGVAFKPAPLGRRSASALGFQLRYYRFPDQPIWSVRVSFTLLALLFAAAAAVFVHQYRRIRRQPGRVIHVPAETWPAED